MSPLSSNYIDTDVSNHISQQKLIINFNKINYKKRFFKTVDSHLSFCSLSPLTLNCEIPSMNSKDKNEDIKNYST